MTKENQATTSPVYTVDQARQAVLDAIPSPQHTEFVDLHDALHRISATEITAVQDIPSFQNSAMDGYALRYQEAQQQKRFKVIGTSLAGHPYKEDVPQGCVVKITTGAFVPPSTDSIVIIENTRQDGDHILIEKSPTKQQYIRNVGNDTVTGATLVAKNKQLEASDLGVIAAQGLHKVKVFRQPRIGVFSTGDELCTAGHPLDQGQIYDSNRITIQSLLKKAGFESEDLGIAKDNKNDIQRVLNNVNDYDFVLSSGGVSVGEADFVKSVLEANGELNFWKVAMKPGKPMVTGKLKNDAIYFGLPGNPVSSVVTCVQFVIPAIQAFCGQRYQPPVVLEALCETDLTKDVGRFEFQRGLASINDSGKLTVSTTGLQDSHVLTSVSQANCFICLEASSSGVKKGSTVGISLFDTLAGL